MEALSLWKVAEAVVVHRMLAVVHEPLDPHSGDHVVVEQVLERSLFPSL